MPINNKIILPLLLSLAILLIPTHWIPLEGITVIEQRVVAIFVLAALCWILEPIPIFATSVLIIVLELLLLSDKGLWFMTADKAEPGFGELLKSTEVMATFASPVIMLFLGGFFLAIAATKYQLDVNLARVLLRPFGQDPRIVMLGLMLITATFSMFMSNTATTAMMLAILTPVLAAFPDKDPAKIGFVLAIPLAANLGGIGTPIGTPPNAVALKYLTGEHAISFGQWMGFAVPFVVLLLLLGWFLLGRFFPSTLKRMDLKIEGRFMQTPRAWVVYLTFITTIVLWLLGDLHGMSSYVVAMIPVAVFLTTGIITKDDLHKISLDVLWLVSGGIALGLALEGSGLAERLITHIPFHEYSTLAVLIGACLLAVVMANFMSNTATANLLLPLVAALAVSMPELAEWGGSHTLILAVTISVSLGMSLPISTPPNALAHATGLVESHQMVRIGVIMGLVGTLLAMVWIYQIAAWGLI
ncbi:TPA: SLC13/DASS family transporter [Aeromonas veronii]|nr:SLC13/DASS family transporter [Aeromonas veronii]